ncbi:hypothetical protein AYO46_06855 [Betaproteobacteria bacterium SCGC AG-212-J23]|nr:hypothetical protein AYO46_06855 [Betaproteobacteria bacterium SCGC AG-212-J23]
MTLIELVVAMVITGIIVAATVYFFYPVAQSVDVAGRAELTDIADNALQRIGREVRLALPNSVRRDASGQFLEFLPVRTAGRYRGDAGGASSGSDCTDSGLGVPASDQLSFDTNPPIDTCFKTIGTVADIGTVTTNDFLAFNNYGPNFTGQDAYASLNIRKISTVTAEANRAKFDFTSGVALDHTLHDSPGRRFFVLVGNATTNLPEAVSYVCDLAQGKLLRRWGYAMTPAQPTSFSTGSVAEIARNVTACSFDYTPNVSPQIGLLTLRLTLSRAVSGSVQSVTLYHSVHVSNIP